METEQLKVGDWIRVTDRSLLSLGECYQVIDVGDNYIRTTHPNVVFSTLLFSEFEKLTDEEAMLWKLKN